MPSSGWFSPKFNKAGLVYEIGVAVYHDKICWVNGKILWRILIYLVKPQFLILVALKKAPFPQDRMISVCIESPMD